MEACNVCELKRKVRANVERGVFGLEADGETLLAFLDACATAEEVETLRRLAVRRQYRAEPKPDWMTDAVYETLCN
jgi:hypothetical protein